MKLRFFIVELVLDVADQFLDDVVKKHHSADMSEFVRDQRDVGFLLEEKFQQHIQRHGFGNHLHLPLDAHQIRVRLANKFQNVLDVNQSERVVEMTTHERKTRVFRFVSDLHRPRERLISIEKNHVAAMRHDIAHPYFVEFEGVDENLALGLGDLLVALALRHQIGQFLGAVGVTMFIGWFDAEDVFQQRIRRTVHPADRDGKNRGKGLQRT